MIRRYEIYAMRSWPNQMVPTGTIMEGTCPSDACQAYRKQADRPPAVMLHAKEVRPSCVKGALGKVKRDLDL